MSEREEQYRRTVANWHGALRRLAASFEADAALREDLLQEILLALWRALPAWRGECSERTFVFRIACNRAVSHAWRRAPRSVDLESAAAVADPAPGPDELASQGQRRDRVWRALRALPLIHREVLGLSLEGLRPAEVAEVLGITENAVGVRLTRARKALRALLDGGAT